MGFLDEGKPYTWKDSREDGVIEHVREHGVEQFLQMWEKVKGINNSELKWGDEIEYGVFTADSAAGTVRCSLRGAAIMDQLRRAEQPSPEADSTKPVDNREQTRCNWMPEYGSWMVEGTPAAPYTGFAFDLLSVERNMRTRRARLLSVLRPDEICPTIPCFPLLGVGQFTEPAHAAGGPHADSLFVPDAVINPHPRFGALTRNIRERRGAKVDIRVPRFRDTHTPAPSAPAGGPPPRTAAEADRMPEVYMDAMAFGMGCCCLQVTFQAREVAESRHLYDQLAVLTPMLLALSAPTPAARGALLDTDSRWSIISQSVDDRTPAESVGGSGTKGNGKGSAAGAAAAASKSGEVYHPAMASGGKGPQHKSRYDSISLYICEQLASSTCAKTSCALNDVPAPYDQSAYERLLAAGVDAMLARHVAHLFSRDPLVVFRGRTSEGDDAESTEHFENLQSTNWQTVRWKPPPRGKPCGPHVGWRVEFRSMEVQLTDFENAAFTVFVILASRVLLAFDLNLYIPLSKARTP